LSAFRIVVLLRAAGSLSDGIFGSFRGLERKHVGLAKEYTEEFKRQVVRLLESLRGPRAFDSRQSSLGAGRGRQNERRPGRVAGGGSTGRGAPPQDHDVRSHEPHAAALPNARRVAIRSIHDSQGWRTASGRGGPALAQGMAGLSPSRGRVARLRSGVHRNCERRFAPATVLACPKRLQKWPLARCASRTRSPRGVSHERHTVRMSIPGHARGPGDIVPDPPEGQDLRYRRPNGLSGLR
jgi:hypothetical protein